MNREDIIRMAREAWLSKVGSEFLEDGFEVYVEITDLERFAALVAAAEREAILLMLKGIDRTETEDSEGWWETSTGADFGAKILDAIRARGQQ